MIARSSCGICHGGTSAPWRHTRHRTSSASRARPKVERPDSVFARGYAKVMALRDRIGVALGAMVVAILKRPQERGES